MNMEIAFRSLFRNFKNTCYVLEFDLDTDCVDKSDTCAVCGGTGYVIKKITKTQFVIDGGRASKNLTKSDEILESGPYYKDGRLVYFLKDCKFDLSPNITRQVLNIVDEQIVDIFKMDYVEPIVADDHIIYYQGAVTRSNINSSKHIQTYNSLIKGR